MSAARKTLLALAGSLAIAVGATAQGDDPVQPAKAATAEEVARDIHALLDEARAHRAEFSEAAKLYARARDVMIRWMNEHPGGKGPSGADLTDLAVQVERERRDFFQKEMPTEAHAWLRQKALEVARDPKGAFEAARLYFFRQVADDLWDHLLLLTGDGEILAELDRMMRTDPESLTAADKARAQRLAAMVRTLKGELLDCWKDRIKTKTCATSYGSGTFIVVPDDGRDAAVRTQRPTPEEWWKQATPEARADWLLSLCAEKGSNLLEVARAWNVDCAACSGRGSKDSTLCPACNGSKVIRSVLWR